ncbi:hypothetical protein BYT27DRAFT_7187467 [Phlegmacium glaucopus]|nr:hypothetical protein BYT27DRAFT_7187457 [Phlegmacium glaucopus]KAF8809655.1 hypothetical protein BYT27DRAFT_7187467 [Phlegmacium glaucopus]
MKLDGGEQTGRHDALKKPPLNPELVCVNHCINYHPKRKEKTNDALLLLLLCVMRDRFRKSI